MLKKLISTAAICIGLTSGTQAATTAYDVAAGTSGGQAYNFILGMDFVVNSAVEVLSLGVFDHLGDGIFGPLTAELWSRSGNTGIAILASASFSPGDQGALAGGSRFKTLPSAVTLSPGEYTMVSYGYDVTDRNGNAGQQTQTWTTNDGGGLISFVGGGRFGGAGGSGIGSTVDSGPVDRYAAGTFTFQSAIAPVPLPASLPLLAAGLLLGALVRRRG